MEKLKKTASGLDVVFRILSWFSFAGIVVIVLLNAAALALGYDRIVDRASLQLSGDLSGVMIDLEDLVFSATEIRTAVLLISASALVALLTVWYGLRIVRRILAPMKEGRPFSPEAGNNLSRLGWLVIAAGILRCVFEAVGKNIIMDSLISSGARNVVVGVRHEIDLSFIIIAFVLFLFSYIFRYGEELQRLSDETV